MVDMPKNLLEWRALIFSILLCQSAGVVGSLFVFSAIPFWYATLTLPPFAPPGWVFGPVWTLLYILMGVSLYIVWRSRGGSIEKGRIRTHGLTVFAVQLVLNALWSVLFFGLQSPLWGLIDIAALDIAVFITLLYFWRVQKSSALLLIPYFVWILFASVLNGFIYYLN